jgi:hypothetical protein
MNTPAPLAAAHALAPKLAGLCWGIGGSTLLHHLGLEAAPRDLDVFTTADNFAQVHAVLTAACGAPGERPPHPRYACAQFARFTTAQGVSIDLMADIAVRTDSGVQRWQFDPASIEHRNGLQWMRAQDWLTLYQLFDRPQRVAQLTAYLAERA